MAKGTFGSQVGKQEEDTSIEVVAPEVKTVVQENKPEQAGKACVFVADGVYKYE